MWGCFRLVFFAGAAALASGPSLSLLLLKKAAGLGGGQFDGFQTWDLTVVACQTMEIKKPKASYAGK